MAWADFWSDEPGTLNAATVRERLADRLSNRVVAALPAQYQGLVNVAQVTTQVASTIKSALTAPAGALGVIVAVVGAVRAIDQALDVYAHAVRETMDKSWTGALDQLSTDLCRSAKGNILAMYRPADQLTDKRAQAYTSTFKKDGLTKLSQLVAQFRPGYVTGFERPGRSDYIAATVPVLVFRGHPLGASVRQSIYSPNFKKWIGPVGADWGPKNRWRPLGIVEWSGAPLRDWIELAVELKDAKGCPPIRQEILVAPGLAPRWGPYAEELPLSATMMAYAAGLLGRPPPDLDLVADRMAKARDYFGDIVVPVRETGILELLWAREDLARRGDPHAGKPRGDAWPGPFVADIYGEDYAEDPKGGGIDGPTQEGGIKGPGGMGPGGLNLDFDAGESAKADQGGGGAVLLLGGLGLAAAGAAVAFGRRGGKRRRRRG